MFLYLNACVENINLICEQFTVPFLVTLYHEIAWSCRHNDAIEVINCYSAEQVKDLMRTIAPGHRSLLGFLINVANLTQYHDKICLFLGSLFHIGYTMSYKHIMYPKPISSPLYFLFI